MTTLRDGVRHTITLAICLLSVLSGVASGQSLDSQLDRVLGGAPFVDRLNLSVCILDGATGHELASHRASTSLIPASNMKLLTSGAALAVLGDDFEFLTELVLFRGEAPDGTDRLVVRGSGDPAFADFELLDDMGVTVEDFIRLWVDAIEGAGVADSVGEIVMDARIFDRELVHPSWPEAQLNRWYCAEVSGLNFHANVLRVYTKPTEVGRPPLLTVEPDVPWLSISNKAKTVGRGKNHTAWASRAPESNTIAIHADVRHATTPIEVTVHEPAIVLGRVIADRLADRAHKEPTVRLARSDEDLSGGDTIHRVRTPIDVVLERCNVDSHNLYAEALIKRTGAQASNAQGTWARGGFALRSLLVGWLGADSAGDAVIADGSGMSRDNRVTTELIARWLHAMDRSPHARAYRASLPSAGEEGTLRKRFRRSAPANTVVAKTGYLSGVSALSGYVTHEATGRTIVFSIISNDKPRDVALSSVRTLEEDIVLMIDEVLSEWGEEASRGG
ncbi:MAG: D-alanyl-D-alanine carboxypeptidase/D-alanyl-D-alanine-endopeptidase [Phycisphaerales bacterium]